MPLNPVDTDRFIRDLDFLSDVTRETLSSLQIGTLLRRVVAMLRDRFGYDYAAVGLVEDQWVRFRAGVGGELEQVLDEQSGPPAWRVPIGKGIVGTVVASGKPKLVNDVTADPSYIMLGFLAKTRSELTVPLVHRDEMLGILDVQSNEVGAFDRTDVRLLEIVAALVAPAINAARLHERWRKRMRYLHLVGEISRLVMSSLTQESVVEVACEAFLETLDIAFAGVALVDRNTNELRHGGHATRLPFLQSSDVRIKMGKGIVGRAAASGEAIRVDNVAATPEFIHVVPGMQSALCIPMRIRDRVVGVLDVEHPERDHFTDEDLHQLEHMGAYLAQALENARLFDDQRRRWQQLLVINEVARIATEPLHLDQILEQVVKEVHDRFGYYAVAVLLKDEREVVLKSVRCDEPLALEVGRRERIGHGVAGTCVGSGEVLQFGRRGEFDADSALREDIESVLCVPLRAQAGVIGAIEVQSRARHAFGSDDRIVMETLAKSVAGSIDNARTTERADKMREDLTRMIVHDLRNPVQAVLLTLREVEQGPGGLSGRVQDSVHAAVNCTEEILGMVNSLLDVSRFEAGKAQLRLSPAVLNDHVRAAVRRLAPLAKERGIQVTTVLSQEVPVVRIDHDLIDRTLTNLVANALKFTPDGGSVTIRTEHVTEPLPACATEAPFVMVAVQDRGEGIPVEYHDKIFEKFGQVESRKAGIKMSTGLGLTLCRHVVEAHGGVIWVDSAPGRGSTFYFSLPGARRSS